MCQHCFAFCTNISLFLVGFHSREKLLQHVAIDICITKQQKYVHTYIYSVDPHAVSRQQDVEHIITYKTYIEFYSAKYL
jgi:hypothetical protein